MRRLYQISLAFKSLLLIFSHLYFSQCLAASHLPLPRYVSTKSSPVNVRVGPHKKHPIKWSFVREKIPLEVVAEFDNWCKIRDWQGTEGWILRNMLTAKRAGIIMGKNLTALKTEPKSEASTKAQLEPGVFVLILKCQKEWCLAQLQPLKGSVFKKTLKGWLHKDFIWGVYKHEEFN